MEKILNFNKDVIAYYDKVRDFQFKSNSEIKLWLIIDFDDVINETTTFCKHLQDLFYKDIGLAKEDFDKIYKDSKLLNNKTGRRIFNFNRFITLIKQKFPAKEKFIEDVFKDTNYNEFIDQAVKRVLQDIKKIENVRTTILTYGDIDYQKRRIDNTDIKNLVDDIVYTDDSKRKVIESLFDKFHHNIENIFTIIVEDNLEHIGDCEDLSLGENYLVIQFHNPQSKRYFEKGLLEKSFISEEILHNQAALNIYNIFKINREQSIKKYRREIINLLNNPLDYNDLESDVEKNIRKAK